MIFNTVALVEVLLAGLIGWGMGWLSGFWEGEARVWEDLSGAGVIILVDLLVRLAAVGAEDDTSGAQAPAAGAAGEWSKEPGGSAPARSTSDDEEKAVHGPLAMIWPSAGGHLFFVPCWIAGIVFMIVKW